MAKYGHLAKYGSLLYTYRYRCWHWPPPCRVFHSPPHSLPSPLPAHYILLTTINVDIDDLLAGCSTPLPTPSPPHSPPTISYLPLSMLTLTTSLPGVPFPSPLPSPPHSPEPHSPPLPTPLPTPWPAPLPSPPHSPPLPTPWPAHYILLTAINVDIDDLLAGCSTPLPSPLPAHYILLTAINVDIDDLLAGCSTPLPTPAPRSIHHILVISRQVDPVSHVEMAAAAVTYRVGHHVRVKLTSIFCIFCHQVLWKMEIKHKS